MKSDDETSLPLWLKSDATPNAVVLAPQLDSHFFLATTPIPVHLRFQPSDASMSAVDFSLNLFPLAILQTRAKSAVHQVLRLLLAIVARAGIQLA